MTAFNTKQLDQFPVLPGVYLMKGESSEILYIGKAKNLRSRVKQYFIPGRDGRLMIPFLVSKVVEIDTIVVSSEKEALLLENNLIKQHKPRYNALLKDDKTYIALKLTTKDKWPMLKIVRYRGSPPSDGLYFGPYTSAFAARQTLDLLNRLFPLRKCSDQEFARRTRPCILYQMKRCRAPCVDFCTKEEYAHDVDRTVKFLRGQDKQVLKDLYQDMQHHADSLEFENAAEIHKTIRYIERTVESQYVDRPLGVYADALGLYREGNDALIVKLVFNEGRLVGSSSFRFHSIADEDVELLSSFIMQHYDAADAIPPEILTPFLLDDANCIEEFLSQKKARKIYIHAPLRGEKKTLIEMAQKNAEALYKSQKETTSNKERLLLNLQEKLCLMHYPARIECFDHSHISGAEPVCSMVVFTEGLKDSKRYRSYRLKWQTGHSDDYAAMREVMTRRYRRAKEEDDLPDLVIVDGGKGQLSIAQAVFADLDITGVDLIGLAKEEGRHDKGLSQEQIFTANRQDPILLEKHSSILFFLQQIRDEAHRTAITFHRKRRSKEALTSELDAIEGIGPVKKKKLLTHFGSLKKVKLATEEELRQVKGLSEKDIQAILLIY